MSLLPSDGSDTAKLAMLTLAEVSHSFPPDLSIFHGQSREAALESHRAQCRGWTEFPGSGVGRGDVHRLCSLCCCCLCVPCRSPALLPGARGAFPPGTPSCQLLLSARSAGTAGAAPVHITAHPGLHEHRASITGHSPMGMADAMAESASFLVQTGFFPSLFMATLQIT